MAVRKIIDLEEADIVLLKKELHERMDKRFQKVLGESLFEPLPILNERDTSDEFDLEDEEVDTDEETEEETQNKRYIAVYLDIENFPRLLDASRHFGWNDADGLRKKIESLREKGHPIPYRRDLSQEQRKNKVHPGSGSSSGRGPKNLELFPGDFYSDMTRIPPRRWHAWYKLWKRKTPVPRRERGISDMRKPKIYFRKIFLFGYQFTDGSLFELWYDSHDAEYIVHDEYGNEAQNRFRIMGDAINGFIYYIAASDPDFKLDQLDRNDVQNMQQVAFGSKQAAERHFQRTSAVESVQDWDNILSEQKQEQEKFVEDTRQTRKSLQQIVDDEMVEVYLDESRITKYMAEVKFWQSFGKDQRVPPKFQHGGFRRAINAIRGFFTGGEKVESRFMEGVSLQGKLDIEIWSINVTQGNRSFSYYDIFDLTSGRRIGHGIPTRREAVRIAHSKVRMPTS